jgi:hypothetical protein
MSPIDLAIHTLVQILIDGVQRSEIPAITVIILWILWRAKIER